MYKYLWRVNVNSLFSTDDLQVLRKKAKAFEEGGSLSSTDYENGREKPTLECFIDNRKKQMDDAQQYTLPGVSVPTRLLDTESESENETGNPQNASILSDVSINSTPDLYPTITKRLGDQTRTSRPIGISKASSNMNFARNSRGPIEHLWMSVENKLQTSLNSHEGLVKLLLHQQLQQSKQASQIQLLRNEVAELRSMMTNVPSLRTGREVPFKPATCFKEYLHLSARLRKDKAFQEQAVTYLSQSGGRKIDEALRRMIPKLLSHELEVKVNFTGVHMEDRAKGELGESTPNGKALSFRHNFLELVTNAIMSVTTLSGPTDDVTIEKAITNYLRRASDRDGGRERRRKRGVPPVESEPEIAGDFDFEELL